MAQRSKADKIEDGHKATARKIAQYGPDEPNRAARQAGWTKQHPGQEKSENPHLREKVSAPADFERVKEFDAWAKTHPNESHSENPFSWGKRVS
jgi:hypothetical protein